MARNPIKMALGGERFHIKVVHLVEMIDFDIKIIPIRVGMRKLEPALWDPPASKIWRPEPDTYVGMCDELRE